VIYAIFENYLGKEKLYFEGSDLFGETTAGLRHRIKAGICKLWNENRVDAFIFFGYSRGSITNLTALAELWNLGGVELHAKGCLDFGTSLRPPGSDSRSQRFPKVLFTGHMDAVSTVMEPESVVSEKYWKSASEFSQNCFHLRKEDNIESEFLRNILPTQNIKGCSDVQVLEGLIHTAFSRNDKALPILALSAEKKLGLAGQMFGSQLALKFTEPRKPVNTFCLNPGSRTRGTIKLAPCGSR
jgi:hypothetical protein